MSLAYALVVGSTGEKERQNGIDDFIEWFLDEKEDLAKPKPQEIVLMKKICMLGDPAVGKTSLIARFVYSIFDDKYLETIGAKVTKKVMALTHLPTGQNFRLKLMLWDIAGRKTVEHVRSSYHREAEGALLVCDVTRRSTLDNMENWLHSFFAVTGVVPVVFIVNKMDLRREGEFGEKDIAALARKYSCPYVLTSAKTGENVEEAFRELGRRLIQHFLRTRSRS
ncbi:MAG: Rab family GTPase [Thermoplasmatota archaeon]